MTRVVIHGSRGRMGQALTACARRVTGVNVVGEIDEGDDLASVIEAAEVVVDFSLASATARVVDLCSRHGKALVLGTTGHTPAEAEVIRSHARRIPMVWSSNFSTGVNVLFWLTRKAAEILGPAYDCEIIEVHHRLKKDAPSGTAITLAETVLQVRGEETLLRHGRAGMVGERPVGEVGVHAVRGGDVVGEHTVLFAGSGERVELIHRATSRETLALGALRAALWVAGRPPGVYSMQHVLGLAE